MKLRPIETADFPLIVKKYVDVFAAEPWNETHDPTQINEYVQNLYAMNTFIGFIAHDDHSNGFIGVALGFIKPWYQGTEYILDTFFIDNTKQHSGLGTIFLKHVKQELHIRSISAIMLDTDRSTPAENFYTKNGFEALKESVLMVSSTTEV